MFQTDSRGSRAEPTEVFQTSAPLAEPSRAEPNPSSRLYPATNPVRAPLGAGRALFAFFLMAPPSGHEPHAPSACRPILPFPPHCPRAGAAMSIHEHPSPPNSLRPVPDLAHGFPAPWHAGFPHHAHPYAGEVLILPQPDGSPQIQPYGVLPGHFAFPSCAGFPQAGETIFVQPGNFVSAEGSFHGSAVWGSSRAPSLIGMAGSFQTLLSQVAMPATPEGEGHTALGHEQKGESHPEANSEGEDSEEDEQEDSDEEEHTSGEEDSDEEEDKAGEEAIDEQFADDEEEEGEDSDKEDDDDEEGVHQNEVQPVSAVWEDISSGFTRGVEEVVVEPVSEKETDEDEENNGNPVPNFEIRGNPSDSATSSGYKKRKRTKKGAPIPEFRKPSPMGTIEIALRRSTVKKTPHIFQPVLGMVFDSREEAYQFYNLYSWERGFGIRYGNSSTNIVNKYRTKQDIVCEKEGYDKRCANRSKRSGCPAMLRLHRTEDHGWYASAHVDEHNHPLSAVNGEKREWKSHSKIEQCTRDLIKYLRENNVTLGRVHSIIGSMYGSMDIPFSQKTLRGVCAQISKESKEDDWQKTLDIFREMRNEDPGFQFSVDFDKQHRVKTLLWTSGRSRSLYNQFGDAITFDTTYCTNLYKMPFGIFVGVNNHFQSTLFAGVMMRRETTKSFKWVFKEFITLMGGQHPKTILTDQDKAMTRAIKEVMPNTKHLWCKWHVLRYAPEDLGPVYRRNGSFRREFHYILNEMLTKDEFEGAWDDIVKRYKLEDHPFMKKTYDKREKWAKPWAKDTFCARMASTQRSESANSMLKRQVPRNTSMNLFVKQYQTLLWRRANAECQAEHETKQFVFKSKRVYAIEKHAMSIYTKNVFDLFREEVDKSTNYNVVRQLGTNNFSVIHNNAEKRQKWARVTFAVSVSGDGQRYSCECGMYEHFGMLCRHALKVMIHEGVSKIPDCHIMKRWTRWARDIDEHSMQQAINQNHKSASQQIRQSILYVNALEVARAGDKDQEAADIIMRHLSQAKKEVERLQDARAKDRGYCSASGSAADGIHTDHETDIDGPRGNAYGASGSSAYMSDSDLENILAPIPHKPKGRPRANRYTSMFDRNRKQKKKWRPDCEDHEEEVDEAVAVVQTRTTKKKSSPAQAGARSGKKSSVPKAVGKKKPAALQPATKKKSPTIKARARRGVKVN
ncbi:hypothetical protein ACP70R_030535 [Stipagrostis hirtigluma subsp. patula]